MYQCIIDVECCRANVLLFFGFCVYFYFNADGVCALITFTSLNFGNSNSVYHAEIRLGLLRATHTAELSPFDSIKLVASEHFAPNYHTVKC